MFALLKNGVGRAPEGAAMRAPSRVICAPMRNQYRLETPGRASYARISEAAKLAAFDPGKLSPEARQSWERLGHDFKAWHDFDQRHPVLRRLALLPVIGGWYRKARRRHVLRGGGRLLV
ncbi:hypothetical protein [Achromobacter sp. Marseille-Q0513]|uniref:hypothetical protein n=1 Tax=Achromobacter sp. Marseille-Q0513 TaxID=2829161 RepID=UPI0020121019|nr:hypothetical protein [Achromobacter sp. Marseille-Q0513]